MKSLTSDQSQNRSSCTCPSSLLSNTNTIWGASLPASPGPTAPWSMAGHPAMSSPPSASLATPQTTFCSIWGGLYCCLYTFILSIATAREVVAPPGRAAPLKQPSTPSPPLQPPPPRPTPSPLFCSKSLVSPMPPFLWDKVASRCCLWTALPHCCHLCHRSSPSLMPPSGPLNPVTPASTDLCQ
jgi:hypothetical protein